MVQLEDVSSAAPRGLICAVSGREEAVHSAGRTAADSSVNEYKTAFPSTCRLLTVWNSKYEHSSSVNIMHSFVFFVFLVCYSDAGSALHETK